MHLAHRQIRRKLHLTVRPGTIAAIVALTSHSSFGELLYPFDDKLTIRHKLDRFRFSLDPRTGAIVADEVEGGDELLTPNMYSDDDEMGKIGLSRVNSRAPLLENGKGNTAHRFIPSPSPNQSAAPSLPYEVEPLVLEHSRPASPSTSTKGSSLL